MPSWLSTEAFNVVVLYDRSALLTKAMATCSHLRRELGEAFALDFRIWRIDLAAVEECAAQFDRDIAAADVIVLGVAGNEPCPPAFWSWKERADADGGAPHAIIALVDAAAEPAAAGETWTNVLRGGAKQIHPQIFVWEPPAGAGAAVTGPPADEPDPANMVAMAGGRSN